MRNQCRGLDRVADAATLYKHFLRGIVARRHSPVVLRLFALVAARPRPMDCLALPPKEGIVRMQFRNRRMVCLLAAVLRKLRFIQGGYFQHDNKLNLPNTSGH